METEKTIRIVIADDHPILREGLRKLLEAEPDLAGDSGLGLGHERPDPGVERSVPQPEVTELRPPPLQIGLLVGEISLQRDVLEVTMGRDQRQSPRDLVQLP